MNGCQCYSERMEPNIEELVVVGTEPIDLTTSRVFARDAQDNIWRTIIKNGEYADHWALHRRADEVVWPTPSVEDVLNASKPKPDDGTIRF
jgi:RES domain-containing protein